LSIELGLHLGIPPIGSSIGTVAARRILYLSLPW
jgi:hypothetical protein